MWDFINSSNLRKYFSQIFNLTWLASAHLVINTLHVCHKYPACLSVEIIVFENEQIRDKYYFIKTRPHLQPWFLHFSSSLLFLSTIDWFSLSTDSTILVRFAVCWNYLKLHFIVKQIAINELIFTYEYSLQINNDNCNELPLISSWLIRDVTIL